jgi:translation initiation factor IF-1
VKPATTPTAPKTIALVSITVLRHGAGRGSSVAAAGPPFGIRLRGRIRCPGRTQHTNRTPHIEGVPIPPPRRRKGGGGKKRREPLTPVVKEDTLSLVGRVIETFPSSTFKVEPENGHTILASLAGRLRRFRIRITPGDDVDVELSPYDLTRGRITYRRQGRNA